MCSDFAIKGPIVSKKSRSRVLISLDLNIKSLLELLEISFRLNHCRHILLELQNRCGTERVDALENLHSTAAAYQFLSRKAEGLKLLPSFSREKFH